MKNTLRFLVLAAMAAGGLAGCGGASSAAAAASPPIQTPIAGVATPTAVSVVTAN